MINLKYERAIIYRNTKYSANWCLSTKTTITPFIVENVEDYTEINVHNDAKDGQTLT